LGKTLTPLYERFVGVALLGIRPCNLTGVRAVPTHRYKRPVPAKGKYLGMCGRVPAGTGKCPNLIPLLTLTILLIDLTRSQRSLGLMTLTRAGFMTRDPREKDVVSIPLVG
jgi:hypothetical protein